ncbi:uncharacterized protein F4807DRAFT_285107 [Annulohypoxylon truncatum]|uniref:uncharacterized protein n=1 Tax=Annulohypoxylon truncatum TaxID=327061 RepID=UPI00200766FC|nr:uncharacterized protein F4807DRAFT_285107 [Annulohypoxylon truncatum]KAI1205436.1 hypothetical protein F4807DRAFT_285107 [Annulohypoxylon truncatum]
MEPPAKRMRLGQAPYDDNDDDEANLDELSMDPTQFDARQDPLYELDKGRAKAASRLKSAFERIFEKYERDFTDIGDEIDLETGEVIVNNGHLLSLEDEKDRNREGSISSEEEERIMRGKETNSLQVSHIKPSIQATPSAHHPLGFHAGPSQQLMAHPQFSSPGIPPNPYGFMDPFMGHGPADPLWQAPDLPMPLYQDRFGFIGQSMGYPPSFGYGYGPMLAPGGGFGHGSFGDFFHPQAPKKLPAKTPARQLLPRVASDADNSEEDDLLLGSNTEEVVKSVSIKSMKSLPPTVVTEKTKQVAPKDVKSIPTAGKEKGSEKPRRGRPKKAVVPAKPPESNDEANGEHGRTIEAAPSIGILNPTEPTNNPTITPIPPSSSSEGPVKEIVGTEITETETSTAVLTEAPTEGDIQSLGSQRRRSSRGRKQTEFYGQITWTKSRRANPDVTDTQDVTEDFVDEPTDLLPPEMNDSLEPVRSEDAPCEETMGPDLNTQPEEVSNKDCVNGTDVTVPSQEHHDGGLPVNIGNLDGDEVLQSTAINPQPIAENSEQPDPLFSIGASINEMGASPGNKEMRSSDKPGKHNGLLNEDIPVHSSEDIAQDTNSAQLDIEEPKLEGLATEDTTVGIDVETTSPSLVDKGLPVAAIEEMLEPNLISDDHRETPQSPTTQIQLEEAAQLPDTVQEKDLSHEAEIAESEIAESEVAELEMPPKSTPSRPSLTEDSDPLSLPDEDEPTLPPARLPISHQSRIPGLFEKAELALRPQVRPRDPRTKIVQRKSVSPSKSPSPSKHRPSLPAKPSTTIPVPTTPKKKRRDSQTEMNHVTASARKKYALTSLVPDDPDEDDDELSVLASSVAPSPFLSSYSNSHSHSYSSSNPPPRFTAHSSSLAATPRKTGRRHGFLMGSASTFTPTSRSALRTPHRISKRGAPPATDSRASRGPKPGYGSGSGVQSSPLARTVMRSLKHRDSLAASPSRRGRNRDRDRDQDEAGSVELGSSPVRTPGGTARRCGEDGFVCERDFCFTCCK